MQGEIAMGTPALKDRGVPLYVAVADRVSELVAAGTLRPGDRIPSVRRLHRQWGVSVSTVLEAYRLLEDRGVVVARPQSGHYVRAASARRLPEPQPDRSSARPRGVDMTDLMVRLTARAHRQDIAELGCGTPDLGAMPLEALGRLMGQVMRRHPEAHGYAVSPGLERLRRVLAGRMIDAGCSLTADDLVITTGAQEGLSLALGVVARPGDTVVVESPTYFGLLEILQAQGLRAIEVPSHPRVGLDLDALAEVLATRDVRAVCVTANFSNPLGSLMPPENKRRLVEWLAQANVPLIEDDVYGELPFEGPRPPACKAYDATGNVIYCSSLSITLARGGGGGGAAPGRFRRALMRRKLVHCLAGASAPQLVAAEFLAGGGYDRHLRRQPRAYREQMLRMTQAVERHFPDGTRLSRPAGGQFLWLELPQGVDAIELFEAAWDEGVSFAPGPMFSPGGAYRGFVRLNGSVPWSARVDGALETLGRLAAAQLGGRPGRAALSGG